MSALQYLKWSPLPVSRLLDARRYRGKTRDGVRGPATSCPSACRSTAACRRLGLRLVAFSPFAAQPDIPEDGDNAQALDRPAPWSRLGQTTTEWLMIAGILTAIAIVLLGVIPKTIRQYTLVLIYFVRTIAP